MAKAVPLSPTTRYVLDKIILPTLSLYYSERLSSLSSNNYVNCSALNKTDMKRALKVKIAM